MIDLLVSFNISILVIVAQVLLFGMSFCLIVLQGKNWTFADAFFVGFILNSVLGVILVPFLGDMHSVSNIVRLVTLLVLFYVTYLLFFKEAERYWSLLLSAIKRSFTTYHFVLSVALFFIVFGYALTHPLSYDDVAHHMYIYASVEGEPYPVFRQIVGEWEAARYPLYGVISSILGQGFSGGGFWVYYLLGGSIFVVFLLKIYETFLISFRNEKKALMFSLLVIIVLSLDMLGNRLNYSLYPLQQAKYLFIMGVVYILFGWGKQKNEFYPFLGLALIFFSVLYHLNLILLYMVLFPVVLVFIYFHRENNKRWFYYLAFSIGLPLLSAPAALSSDGGFLNYKEEIVVISDEPIIKVEKERESKLEIVIRKFKKLFKWFTDGRYKSEYIVRVFSSEIFLIPLIMLLGLYISILSRWGIIYASITLVVVTVQFLSTVPKQLFYSAFRAGAGWMIYDIGRSGIDFKNLSGGILTDSYTGFYLKLFGAKNVLDISDKDRLLTLSPLFSTGARDYVVAKLSNSTNVHVLVNGRFLGVSDKNQWNGLNESKLNPIVDRLDKFNTTANVKFLTELAYYGASYVKAQFNTPIFLYTTEISDRSLADYEQAILSQLPREKLSIYRDAAIVRLTSLKKNEKIIIEFRGASTGNAEYMESFSNVRAMKVISLVGEASRRDELLFNVISDVEELTLLFKMSAGRLDGLGVIDEVVVRRVN